MLSYVKKLLTRSDLLLIILPILVSVLLYARFAPEAGPVHEQTTSLTDEAAAEPQSETASPAGRRAMRAGEPVRFLMYNTQNYFVDRDVSRSRFSRTFKPVNKREAVADAIASVKPQVVGLVEMGGPAALDDLAVRLAARGLQYPYRKALTRWGEDRALAVLSMHPIVEDHSVADCLLLGQTSRRMLRGILDVTVELEDKRRFRIIGAHLKSRVSDDPMVADALRAREARTLAEHIRRAMNAQPEQPILVYGDWNDGPSDTSLGVMTQGGNLKRLNPVDSRGEGWTIYYDRGQQYCTFDQIYVNSALSRRMGRKSEMGVVSENTKGSDHRPVWCDMR